MKFGVREICNVVFKAKSDVTIGTTSFKKGEPVLYIDSAKTSTLEGAATTVYATGGRGNARLLAWEGEKTLTFTVEDALLSPIGFAILSGAGLFKGDSDDAKVHVHTTATVQFAADGTADLANALEGYDGSEELDTESPIFVLKMDGDDIVGKPEKATVAGTTITVSAFANEDEKTTTAFVDFYILKGASKVSELQIDAETFAGYYYVEANCLFKRKADGVDMPAELTLPKVKIQSNFTFSMAATGDPSTFTFTMDAMPDYTFFNRTRKVLCAVQIIEDAAGGTGEVGSVFTEDYE